MPPRCTATCHTAHSSNNRVHPPEERQPRPSRRTTVKRVHSAVDGAERRTTGSTHETEVLIATDISKSFRKGGWPRRARRLLLLRGANLTLHPGEGVGLVGENVPVKAGVRLVKEQDVGVFFAFLLPFLDLAIVQGPMLHPEPTAFSKFLPGYGGSRILLDGALTRSFDEALPLLVALGWLVVLGLSVALTCRHLVRAAVSGP